MKFTFARPALLLAFTLGLGACGGKAMFDVSGQISGLVYAGLVLSNNGSDLTVPAAATTFRFPNQLAYGELYHVSVKTSPAHQTCSPAGADATGAASDTAGRMASINIGVVCAIQAHTIGGTISGLTVDGLVLTNGSGGGTLAPAAASTTFAFAVQVPYNVSYGVSVLTNPAGLKCTVTNGTAVMGDADVSNIAVACLPG